MSSQEAVIYDTEFLTDTKALSRIWSGPDDPDPLLVQIGALRIGLRDDLPIKDEMNAIVIPRGRNGEAVQPTDFFTELTGICADRITEEGMEYEAAIQKLAAFGAPDCRFWSWGRDDYFAVAISGFIAGVSSPISAHRFGNLRTLFWENGITDAEELGLSSNQIGAHYGAPLPAKDRRAHDALDDAHSLVAGMRALMKAGRLPLSAFQAHLSI